MAVKKMHFRVVSLLLALILLLQVPAVAGNEDGIEEHDCKQYEVPYDDVRADSCKENGWEGGSYCSFCNRELTAPKKVTANLDDPNVHVELKIEEAYDPSCTEPGATEGMYCAFCGYRLVEQEVIQANGHEWEVFEAAVEPTCTEAGWTAHRKCTVCDLEEERKEVPAKGHTSETDEAVEATCTETGRAEGTHCTVRRTMMVDKEVVDAK